MRSMLRRLLHLSLADLAHRLHCSATHLSCIFHAATGYTLCDYRGFASHSHFTSAFHRRFGVKPSDFLKWRSRKVIRAMAAY